ncbi:MAG: hypothetical protein MdMp014T_2024 [Treponematales bacterium]
MKKIFALAAGFAALFLSGCFWPDTGYDIYYKSYFLGADSFLLNGVIYDMNCRTQDHDPGTTVTATVYGADDWEIQGAISGNAFSLDIDKTANGVTLMAADLSEGYANNALHWFFPYFFDREYYTSLTQLNQLRAWEDIPTFGLNLDLEEQYWRLIEFDTPTTSKYPDEHISYYYITEPANITGSVTVGKSQGFSENTTFHFNCNFTQPGWYKIREYEYHKIGSGVSKTGKNVRMRQYMPY